MFTNNLLLCKLIWRRDRLQIILWFVGIAALVVGFGSSLPDLYGSVEGRASMLIMAENPAMVAMMGKVHLPSNGYFGLGSMYSTFMLVWCAMFMGIMNIFHVVRHTRQDEERGRIEVIRSLPVGRLTNLSATLTTAVIINLSFTILLGLGLGLVGSEDMDMAGGMLFASLMGVAGLAFAAITAIFCQVCANPRTAQGLSFTALIGMYLLRAAADMQDSLILNIISPLGIITEAKTYVENLWWPVFVSLAISAVLILVSFMLCGARDMGAGLIPAKPGKRDAAPYLKNPTGLAWRLLKTPFIIWVFAIPLLSMSYGSIMGDIETFIESMPAMQQLTGGDPLVLVGLFMVIMAMAATIPVLQFMLKARSQESGGYAEHIIARSVSRSDQLRGYFIIALVTGIIMPFLNCVGFWFSCYAFMEKPIPFMDLFNACMIYVPAILFMLGVAIVLIAYLPNRISIAWIYLGYSFATIYMGALIGLPEWLSKLSPFGLIPQLPMDEVTGGAVTLLVGMCVLSVAMYVLGFIGYKNRDMKF